MDKNQAVVALCIAYGEASAAGDYRKALDVALKGRAEYPHASLPQDATWDGLIKLAESRGGLSKQEPAAQAAESQDQAVTFTVFMPDGEPLSEGESDLDECRAVASELGIGARVEDSNGFTVFEVEPEPQPVVEAPRKETMREKLARIQAEKVSQPEVAPVSAAPVSAPAEPQVLRIVHESEHGTVLHGTRKGDGVNEIAKALGWRYFNRTWYIAQSKDHAAQQDKIALMATELQSRGFVVEVEIDDQDPRTGQPLPKKMTAAERKAQREAEKLARRAEQAAQVARAAAAKAAAPISPLSGMPLFAAAAQQAIRPVSAPVSVAPVRPVSVAPVRPVSVAPVSAPAAPKAAVRKSAAPVLEGLAATPGAMWWRMGLKDGINPKDSATAIRGALKAIIAEHSVEGEDDLALEVRLNRETRTVVIAAVLPQRESALDARLIALQVPGVASMLAKVTRDGEQVRCVGSLIESHSDF